MGGDVEGQAAEHDDHAIGLPLAHEVDIGFDPRFIVAGVGHQHLVAGIGSGFLDALEDLEIEGVGDVAHQKDDGSRRLLAERAGLGVGNEIGFPDHRQHSLERFLLDHRGVVQRARHRRGGHASDAGNLVNGFLCLHRPKREVVSGARRAA